MNSSPYILLAAMPLEADLLTAGLKPRRPVGKRPARGGMLGGKHVVLALTGMGAANAALTAGIMLERYPEAKGVINLGCAGAYAGAGLGAGQAVVANEALFGDMGVLNSRGPRGLKIIGIPLLESGGQRLFNRVPVDAALSDELAAGVLARGAFATVGMVSGDPETAARYEMLWGAALEDMETAAVALAALACGKPFAAVRGVSNIAGRRDLDVKAGARAAQMAVLAWAGAKEIS